MSEEYGRRNITVVNFIFFTLFTMACALAPSWKSFLVFRLLSGTFGSSVVAIAPGILADVYHNPGTRGWSIAIFMAVCIMIFRLITWLTSEKGDRFWSHVRSYSIRLRLASIGMEMVLLGCPHICWGFMHLDRFSLGDEHEFQHLSSRFETDDIKVEAQLERDNHSSPAEATLPIDNRTHCQRLFRLFGIMLLNILHVLPGVPYYFRGAIQSLTWSMWPGSTYNSCRVYLNTSSLLGVQ